MGESEPLQPDRKPDITTPYDILDLEFLEPRVETQLLDDACVFPRGETRVVFRFGTRDDHLARGEDEGGRLRVSDTHDDGGESLGRPTLTSTTSKHSGTGYDVQARVEEIISTKERSTHLGIVLGVPGMHRDRLEIQPDPQVYGGDDVSGHDRRGIRRVSGRIFVKKGRKAG